MISISQSAHQNRVIEHLRHQHQILIPAAPALQLSNRWRIAQVSSRGSSADLHLRSGPRPRLVGHCEGVRHACPVTRQFPAARCAGALEQLVARHYLAAISTSANCIHSTKSVNGCSSTSTAWSSRSTKTRLSRQLQRFVYSPSDGDQTPDQLCPTSNPQTSPTVPRQPQWLPNAAASDDQPNPRSRKVTNRLRNDWS